MPGNKILYYRKKQGLTQQQLALGICSISYLSKIENDKILPNSETMSLLFDRLEIKFDQATEYGDHEDIIDDWCRSVEMNDEKKSNTLKSELESRMKYVNNPYIQGYFHLVKWRYDMSQYNSNHIEISLRTVKSYYHVFNNKLKYLFYKFLCIYNYNNKRFMVALHNGKEANHFRSKIGIIDVELQYILALSYSQLKSISLSIIYAQEALENFQKDSNLFRMIDCLILLGINFARVKEFEKAHYYYQRSLKLSEHTTKKSSVHATVYHNLGYLYSLKSDNKLAIKYYLKAINKKKSLNLSTQGTIYLLANEYYIIGSKENAIKWISTGLSTNKDLNTSLINLKILKYSINKHTKKLYEFLLNHALPFFKEKQDWVNISRCSELLGDHYSAKAQYKAAASYYKLAYNSSQQLGKEGGAIT